MARKIAWGLFALASAYFLLTIALVVLQADFGRREIVTGGVVVLATSATPRSRGEQGR
ncbi:MAG: hypothetical protein M3217_12955 [Actinomycetota bacterium]|nr:hypothetical protein [Actinomycetota bacterium]